MRLLRHLVLGLGLGLVGCVNPTEVVCPGPEARICADGLQCAQVTLTSSDQPVTVCVLQAQLDSCAAADNGRACVIGSDDAAIPGTCHDQICLPDACGNQLVDSTEVCDDGNTSSTDGCAADCRSNEQCRNGHVDPLVGEQCDDGDALGRDGCSSTCALETPRWTLQPGSRPPERTHYALAFDAQRHRSVLFGGADSSNGPLAETYEWDGRHWAIVPSAIAPPPRFQHAMAYDAARHVVVLFGGYNGSVLADTWEWDGATWSQRTSAHAPPARAAHAMVYDSARHKIVLFGGFIQTTVTVHVQDTWEWDGTDWAEVTSAAKPSARVSSAMAYDPVRGVSVLFGGISQSTELADVWELGAGGWSQVTPSSTSPSTRSDHAMAFDRGEVLLIGGSHQGLGAQQDVWSWNGARWRRLADLPEAMKGLAATHDAPRGRVLVMSTGATTNGLALEWDGAAWTNAGTPAIPTVFTPRLAHITVGIPTRRQILTYGGDPTSDATWLWDDGWRTIPTATRPTSVGGAAAGYDAATDQVVMFGGFDKLGAPLGTTWLWNGVDWALGAAGPSARTGAAMAYDAMHHQIVMFGGGDASNLPLADTWLWNGTGWTLSPAVGPSARTRASMAYDPIARKVVLFGGLGPNTASDETWEWDGAAWTRATPPVSPIRRSGSGMAWDAARRRLVLFGGRAGGGPGASTLINDTWEAHRDGSGALVWTQLDPVGVPSVRSEHGLVPALDGAGVLVVCGGAPDLGAGKPIALGDVWQLRWDAHTPYESCGDVDNDGDALVGCADPDCWASCSPLCPPGAVACDTASRCGDGTCNPARETCYLCPADCGACAATCGDLACTGGETHASCPGDCP